MRADSSRERTCRGTVCVCRQRTRDYSDVIAGWSLKRQTLRNGISENETFKQKDREGYLFLNHEYWIDETERMLFVFSTAHSLFF